MACKPEPQLEKLARRNRARLLEYRRRGEAAARGESRDIHLLIADPTLDSC